MFNTKVKDKSRADYVAIDQEMYEHLLKVTQEQHTKIGELINSLRLKVMGHIDKPEDWLELREQEKQQNFYYKELRLIAAKIVNN